MTHRDHIKFCIAQGKSIFVTLMLSVLTVVTQTQERQMDLTDEWASLGCLKALFVAWQPSKTIKQDCSCSGHREYQSHINRC